MGETARLATVNDEIDKLKEEIKEAKEPAGTGEKAEVELQPMTKEKPNEESKAEPKEESKLIK